MTVSDVHDHDGSVASRTAFGALWMIAWRFFSRLLGFASTLVMARLLLPADFGLVAIATMLSTAVESMSEIGLRDGLVRHAEDSRALTNTAFTLQAARGLLTATVIGSSAWLAADWFNDERLVPLVLTLAAVSFAAGLENISIVKFQRELRFDLQFRLLLLPRLLQFGVTIVAALLLRNYWALMLGIVVGRIARNVMTYVVVPYRPGLTLSRWRDLIGFSSWTWVSSGLGVLLTRSESFILGPVLGPTYFGVYFVGLEIGLLPSSEVIAPAASALFAGFALASNRGGNAIRFSPSVMGVLMVAVAPFGIGISATAGYVVAGLLGPTWDAARPVIAIAGLMCIIYPVPYVAVMVLTASGRVNRAVYAKAGSVLMKLFVLLLLPAAPTPKDVAAAVAVALAGECAMFWWQLRACCPLEWRPAFAGAVRSAAGCTVAAAMLWTTGLGWQPVTSAPIAAFLAGVPIGGAAVATGFSVQFLLWLAANRPEGPETRLLTLVRELAPKLRRRLRMSQA
jgi:lipopolysaccharide exporter